MAILKRGLRRGLLDRVYDKLLHKYFVNDLWLDLRLAAKKDSVDYALANMQAAQILPDRWTLLKFALARAPATGLVLEFGVANGDSVNHLGVMHEIASSTASILSRACRWIGAA